MIELREKVVKCELHGFPGVFCLMFESKPGNISLYNNGWKMKGSNGFKSIKEVTLNPKKETLQEVVDWCKKTKEEVVISCEGKILLVTTLNKELRYKEVGLEYFRQ